MKLSIKAALAAAPFALIGCSSMPTMSSAPDVPAPIAVPAGTKMSMRTVGVGELTYECREKQGAAGTFEWVFVAPTATLWDANRTKAVGKYYAWTDLGIQRRQQGHRQAAGDRARPPTPARSRCNWYKPRLRQGLARCRA